VIILSSIGAFKFEKTNEEVDEEHGLKLDEARYRVEEELREKGAMILYVAGILGEKRTPKIWFENGWIKYGQTVANLIHVDDIVFFIGLLFEHFKPCEKFNLSNGDFRTWNEINAILKTGVEFTNADESLQSKKVLNGKLLDYLNLKNFSFIKYPENFCD